MTKVHPASWHDAKDVVFEALRRPAHDRDAFVRARVSDADTCAAVLALLKDCATADDRCATQTAAFHPPEIDDLDPGTRVGPYIILDRIGRGGMGQVFLGNDPRLHRKVALKCLTAPRASGADLHARILHEARAAGRISHPNVATVHDVLEHGTRAFIVMEYVEGQTLAARLRRERLPLDQVMAIGRQLASALAAAHAEGIVHRDLKPGNIQITPAGSVKVLDFGVANVTQLLSSTGASAATTRLRGAEDAGGTLLQPGTPQYMSPEQLLGREVDERSDIYSLGVVLFEMATGARPYAGRTPTDLVLARAEGLPRPDESEPRLPRALADVIAKALESDPARRFQSATEIGTALEALAAAPPLTAGRQALIITRVARAAAAAAIVTLGLGLIGFFAAMGFNDTFGRIGPYARFGAEPWRSFFWWGFLAIFPSFVMMTLVAVIVVVGAFALRLLALIGPVARAVTSVRRRLHGVVQAAGLDRANVLAQALSGLGVVAIVALYWWQRDLINAWTSQFNSAPLERLLPMGPRNFARLYYRVTLDVFLLAFGAGLFKVLRMRTDDRTRDAVAGIAMLTGVVLVIVLLIAFPYRILTWRDFERVDLAGERCYLTGQTAEEFLVLCPAASPPRNRVVKRDDATLRRLGVMENVFEGVSGSVVSP